MFDNYIVEMVGQTGELYSAVNRAISILLKRGYTKKYFFELLIGRGWKGTDDVINRFLEEQKVFIRPKFMRAIQRNQIIIIARKDEE